MKPYGLPRLSDIESPDKADIHNWCLKSSAGKFREKGGDFKNSRRNTKKKKQVRRSYKKAERHKAKEALRKEGTFL